MYVRTTFEQSRPRPEVLAKVAVTKFLKDMKKAAQKAFPQWHETLVDGVEECALSYDARRGVLEIHPLDDYYFAATVALEAVKVRQLFTTDEAAELLSLIGEQVDAVAGRTDRVVSDMVFFLVGRLHSTASGSEKPYDQAVKAILQHIGLDRIEATRHLMEQVIYRHTLGEPLALGVPNWWQPFHDKYALARPADAPGAPMTSVNPPISATSSAQQTARRRVPRRATVF